LAAVAAAAGLERIEQSVHIVGTVRVLERKKDKAVEVVAASIELEAVADRKQLDKEVEREFVDMVQQPEVRWRPVKVRKVTVEPFVLHPVDCQQAR